VANNNGAVLVLTLGLVGVAVYLFVSNKPREQTQTASTTGGQTSAAPQDLFSSILRSIQSVASTIEVARTNPQTT
jgi:hypothetical protein